MKTHETKRLGYLAIDQYGNNYHLKKYPRKELLEHFAASKADKMYVDTCDGKAKHIGYVIKGHWCKVYEVHEAFQEKTT